jgi:hypothetical protein
MMALRTAWLETRFCAHVIKPVWRYFCGRIFVWRDSPLWVVAKAASTEIDEDRDDFDVVRLVQAARREMGLRMEMQARQLGLEAQPDPAEAATDLGVDYDLRESTSLPDWFTVAAVIVFAAVCAASYVWPMGWAQ